jgi:putative serine protease PepD
MTPPVKGRVASNPFGGSSYLGADPTFVAPAGPPPVTGAAPTPAVASPPPERRRWGWRTFVAFIAGGLLSGAGFTAGTMVNDDGGSVAAAAPVTTPVSTPAGPAEVPLVPSGEENPAAFVAAELGPSVVQIATGFGTGSGVVYREGYIMTNNHVVDGETDVFIVDSRGRTLPGTVVGSDPRADIAVVRVEDLDLPVAELALDQELAVGQTAIAIGSPFDLTRTVTSGIISALNRPLQNLQGIYTAMIQTDAPINPGNSGGPLANRNAQVIGINTAIRTDGVSNTNVGVGFAVPIDIAHRVAERIVNGESLDAGFLGVGAGQPAIGEIGVVIDNITQGSGAENAGLLSGDRVLTVNGAAVTDFAEMASLISSNFPGDQVTMEIVRDGQQLEIVATLGERP